MSSVIENRKARANQLGWVSCIIGAVSASSVFIAGLFAAAAGMSRELDLVLILSELIVAGALLFGVSTAISAIVLGQRRKGSIGITLCVVSALAFWFVARHFMSPA